MAGHAEGRPPAAGDLLVLGTLGMDTLLAGFAFLLHMGGGAWVPPDPDPLLGPRLVALFGGPGRFGSLLGTLLFLAVLLPNLWVALAAMQVLVRRR